ncbi:MAG: DEAD/DEAH box helicase [Verrucomicrobia bacterium]|nr:DEAD/DEAH box helicase [Verrucomicrobiota bacterium]
MSLELAISPGGRLFVERTAELVPVVDERWVSRLAAAFDASAAEGLLLLVTDALTLSVPPSPTYWRDFARGYLQRLCHTGGADSGPTPLLSSEHDKLSEFVQGAPPMRGGEFLTTELLERLWQEFGALVIRETAAAGLSGWLKSKNPLWQTVGRVTFHLAENKRDPNRPFAFLATYTHRLSQQGKPQHLPLARALQEYAGTKNKAALTSLLDPVQRAAEKSDLVHQLVETRRLFQPLAWNPHDAHRFLLDIPLFEESGLLVRVPDWWKGGRPARPQVSVRIGEKPSSLLGLESLMDFSVEISLEGERLTGAEYRQLMAAKEGLLLLKGKWIEIDRERLTQVLAYWQEIEKGGGEGISFLEGMRLLAGMGPGDDENPLAQPDTRGWSLVRPGEWLRKTLEAMRDPSVIEGFDPERDLRAQLRGYQREGVRWLWFMTRLGLGACLADDMGLGKTIQTLALLLQLKRETARSESAVPSLLVAPASLLANWKSEIARFAPTLDVFFAHPSETSPQTLKDIAGDSARTLSGKNLVLTTYGLLTRLSWLRQVEWRLVVLDEAQAIKNPAARQTCAVKELRAQARIALTGTPVENRIGDLWSLFSFICPGLLGSATEFGQTVKRLSSDQGRHFAPVRNLTRPHILRRLKTDKSVISDLPEKTEVEAWCGLSKAQAALYQQSVKELGEKLDIATGIQRRGLILAFLMRFKQICNHPSHWLGDGAFDPNESGKFLRLQELGEEIAARQEKSLVFTQFKEMTGPLAAHLEGIFGRPGLIFHGATRVKERRSLVERFQQDGGPPFFILSLKAGGTGLNLTAASHVIHFDRWWNPAVENQATDRAFRIGQKKNVMVHKFVCRGTIEERISNLLEEKKSLSEELIEGGGEKLLTEMPDDELLRLVALDLKSAVPE